MPEPPSVGAIPGRPAERPGSPGSAHPGPRGPSAASPERLRDVLAEARRRGFLGPGPVEPHLLHAARFGDALSAGAPPGWEPAAAGDLGSGGGLPGLPLALRFPSTLWFLIEANGRRAAFLREALVELDVEGRVRVVEERAEVVGRDCHLRTRLDLVVARSFGRPAAVAECAAPLLGVGGRAVVSDPPGGAPDRWPAAGLDRLGLRAGPTVVASGSSFQVLIQHRLCDDRYPRRTGVPAKRPLF